METLRPYIEENEYLDLVGSLQKEVLDHQSFQQAVAHRVVYERGVRNNEFVVFEAGGQVWAFRQDHGKTGKRNRTTLMRGTRDGVTLNWKEVLTLGQKIPDHEGTSSQHSIFYAYHEPGHPRFPLAPNTKAISTAPECLSRGRSLISQLKATNTA